MSIRLKQHSRNSWNGWMIWRCKIPRISSSLSITGACITQDLLNTCCKYWKRHSYGTWPIINRISSNLLTCASKCRSWHSLRRHRTAGKSWDSPLTRNTTNSWSHSKAKSKPSFPKKRRRKRERLWPPGLNQDCQKKTSSKRISNRGGSAISGQSSIYWRQNSTKSKKKSSHRILVIMTDNVNIITN